MTLTLSEKIARFKLLRAPALPEPTTPTDVEAPAPPSVGSSRPLPRLPRRRGESDFQLYERCQAAADDGWHDDRRRWSADQDAAEAESCRKRDAPELGFLAAHAELARAHR